MRNWLFLLLFASTACEKSDPSVDAAVDGQADANATLDGEIIEPIDAQVDAEIDAPVLDAPMDGTTDAGLERIDWSSIDRTPDPACTSGTWAVGVMGTVSAEDGAPLSDVRAQFCVQDARTESYSCLPPAISDEAGHFEILVPEITRCVGESALRLIKPNAGLATTYHPIAQRALDGATDALVTLTDRLTLYAVTPATTLPPEGDRSMTRTIEFENGLSIEARPDRIFGSAYETFGSRLLESTAPLPSFLESFDMFDEVYAITPEASIGGTPFVTSVLNRHGLAPSSVVYFYVLGGVDTRYRGELIAEGRWGTIGTGHVTSDGERIQIDEGLPYMSWLAYRTTPLM